MIDPDNEEPTEDVAIDSRDLLKFASPADEPCPRCGEPMQLHRIDQAQFMSLGREVRLCTDGRPTSDLLPLRQRSDDMDNLDAFLRPQAEIDLIDAEARRLRAQQLNASFANAPVSIGEARAKRDKSAATWTPRDALVGLLREIDSGETKVSALVVTFAVEHEDGRLGHGFRNAAPDNFTALGLLARASHRLQED